MRAYTCFILLIFVLSLAFTSYGQDSTKVAKDSLDMEIKGRNAYRIIPRQSTIKSAILPGWGQWYNRQYWKLPLVAGGFVTLGLIAKYNNERYFKYRSYYYIVSPRPADPTYKPPSTVDVPWEDGVVRSLDINQLKRINDGFRRNRDFTYIGMAIFWAFNVIDANVSAHLKTFDVSDDISMRIKPQVDFTDQHNLFAGIGLNFYLR